MAINLRHLHNPSRTLLSDSYDQFLSQLDGPTVIHIDGRDTSLTRVVVTLLHGNEPSGLKAMHRFMCQAIVPATNLVLIIASVNAAKTLPFYTHRMPAGERDLNRCFYGPYHDSQGQLADAIVRQVRLSKPQAIVDVHNTSGSGPDFCVSAVNSPLHLNLASHFSKRIIYTDIRLGAIMEQDFGAPIITVEAGGAKDIEADENAFCGLYSFLTCDNPFELQQDVEPLIHPRRLELLSNAYVGYGKKADPAKQLTLYQDIEKFNFGITPARQTLGWLPCDLSQVLTLDNGNLNLSDFFTVEHGMLKTVCALKLFMVTTREDIAKSDCLFYFVKA